jgi:cation diffusion facilitator CzcD-associated flavoprotein CzcO
LPEEHAAIVVGAGPAGLAVLAELTRRGVDAVGIDRGDEIGSSWRNHYDRLRLNTVRWISHMPGAWLPRRYGRYVARDDVIAYLKQYASRRRLPVRLGVEAHRIEPGQRGRWRVVAAEESLESDSVVVATGYCRIPRIPAWPGLSDYRGELVHSSAYRHVTPYRNREVLVVGAGNSAAEIAVDLAHGGARRVWMAVRTPPQVVPRSVMGVPTILVAVATRRLPPVVGDTLVRALQRWRIGDLSAYGLPSSTQAVSRQFSANDVVPITHPEFVPTLRSGRIQIVAAVSELDGPEVVLAGGTRLRPEAVIAATGYERGLHQLVGGLGVVTDRDLPSVHGDRFDQRAPGVHFIGFTNPLTGNLRELRLDARRIARGIASGSASASNSSFATERPSEDLLDDQPGCPRVLGEPRISSLSDAARAPRPRA